MKPHEAMLRAAAYIAAESNEDAVLSNDEATVIVATLREAALESAACDAQHVSCYERTLVLSDADEKEWVCQFCKLTNTGLKCLRCDGTHGVNACGEPKAWLVYQPPGSEHEYKVYANKNEADSDVIEQPEGEAEALPLVLANGVALPDGGQQ